MQKIMIGDIYIDVVRKVIKNVHLSVYPPLGRVRISAPFRMDLDTIRVFAISKLNWIKKQQHKLRSQEREAPPIKQVFCYHIAATLRLSKCATITFLLPISSSLPGW